MSERKIFTKSKSINKIILFCLFIFLLLFIFIYYFIISNNNEFIIISENVENIYIIPEDKGGEKVPNLNKKILNLKSQPIIEYNSNKPEDLLFSIQFYSNNDIEKVSNFLKKITKFSENIYNIDDFNILVLKSEIGIDYFLLYKNFKTRIEANNYCLNFLAKIEKCLVVDATKF